MADQDPFAPVLTVPSLDSAEDAAQYPAYGRAAYVMLVLMLVTFTALLDRYLPSITLGPMKHDLGLTDTSVSIVQGMSFSLFYCVAGIPLGRMVDHYSRRNLLVAAVLVWTILTFCSGVAQGFATLCIARAGVGIAEAVLAPAAYSMIADCFPPHLRGRAIGFYFASLIVGSNASFIAGGALLSHLAHSPWNIPLLGVLAPWRESFVIFAFSGIPAALLGLTLREPRRMGRRDGSGQAALTPFLRANTAGLTALYVTFGLEAFVSVIAVSWAPTLYNRTFAIPVPRAAITVGMVMLVAGLAGALASGLLSDFWVRRAGAGRFRVQMTSLLLSVPLLTLWPLMTRLDLSYTMLGICTAVTTFGMSSNAATLQDIAPNHLRGQLLAISAIVLLLTSGISPTAVALATDQIFRNPAALPWSMALVGGIFGLAGVIAAYFTARRYALMRLPAA